MRYRAAFFDFGGTLFRYADLREQFDEMLQGLLERHEIRAPADEVRRVYRDSMARSFASHAEKPFYLHRDLFAHAHSAFLDAFGVSAGPEQRDVFYEGQADLGMAAVTPRPGAAETLAALRDAGLHVAIVSNIDDDQFAPLWERMGLGEHFHATTTSEEARSCKPHPGIFQHALAKTGGVRPEEVLFIGDSPFHDVAGAKPLGMTTVLIAERARDLPPEQQAHHVIQELPELLDLLKE